MRSCDELSETIDIVCLHFSGLLISFAWWIGTSGTLTSSNSSWPTAVIVYQSGWSWEISAYLARVEGAYWSLIFKHTDSRSNAGNSQAGHGILNQVRAARAEEGRGLGVLPGIVARMVDAADGRRRSSVSMSGWRRKGTNTYPAMVASVSFHEQYLGKETVDEKTESWKICDGIRSGRLFKNQMFVSTPPKNGVT